MPDGLWIGDQVSERVFKVDWKTGKVLHEMQTESHNTSGIAIGAGYLWLGANGGVSGRRPPRPADKPFGEVIQADLKTGKTIKIHPLVWGGGVHGITFVPQTQTLVGHGAERSGAGGSRSQRLSHPAHACSAGRSGPRTGLGQRRASGACLPETAWCRRSTRSRAECWRS